ncbi:helix-turn-helix domain-containing protein [Amycolatopsis saalfeldensis]|uniref:Helix-turn-helix domain-containing protein n=1 Tax=Amycolatopsis saalfeldensis TaxID=394193 RepID=A0A1H8U786_9PSEU|nr:helix-turn-helix transcriptional regulator [Amycolatopsis saalfeldensis]SEO99051.1 Helix-turn-helix domain-containing protein [Amycolatopsis saalfeldensis]
MAQRDEETVGRRIHRLRTGLGLTQRELATPSYTPGYVSAVESDRRKPSAEAMRHFAFRLGLDLEELATGRTADPVAGQELALLEALIAGDRQRLAALATGPVKARALTDLATLTPEAAPLREGATALLTNEPPHLRVEAAPPHEETTTPLTNEPPRLPVETAPPHEEAATQLADEPPQLRAEAAPPHEETTTPLTNEPPRLPVETAPPHEEAATQLADEPPQLRVEAAPLHEETTASLADEPPHLPAETAPLHEEATTLLADEPPHLRVEASAGRAVRLRRSGEFRYARHLLRTIRDELHESGHPDPAALVFVDAHLAACDVQVGDDSSPAAAEALALALPSPELSRDLNLRLARTLLAAGRFDDARVAVAQARAAHRQLGLRAELALCHQARARTRQAAGDLSGAAADLGQARAMLTAGGEYQAAADVGTELAGVHRELGNLAGARALLENVLATAEPDTSTAARAHRQLGLLLLPGGENTAAEQSLRTAVSIFERTGPGHDLARALLDLADVLAAHGDPGAAAEALSAGLRSAERIARSATG